AFEDIRNYFSSSSESPKGGAVYNQGSLALEGVIVQNNQAHGRNYGPIGFGGVAYATGGMGGGLYSSGTLTITDTTIQNNSAIGGSGYSLLAGFPGSSSLGGGIYIAGGTAIISNSTIAGNAAQGGTGGPGYTGYGSTDKYTKGGFAGGDALGGGLYAAA